MWYSQKQLGSILKHKLCTPQLIHRRGNMMLLKYMLNSHLMLDVDNIQYHNLCTLLLNYHMRGSWKYLCRQDIHLSLGQGNNLCYNQYIQLQDHTHYNCLPHCSLIYKDWLLDLKLFQSHIIYKWQQRYICSNLTYMYHSLCKYHYQSNILLQHRCSFCSK